MEYLWEGFIFLEAYSSEKGKGNLHPWKIVKTGGDHIISGSRKYPSINLQTLEKMGLNRDENSRTHFQFPMTLLRSTTWMVPHHYSGKIRNDFLQDGASHRIQEIRRKKKTRKAADSRKKFSQFSQM
mmetsp:Transcript_62303/g.71440  ORF Transcript_62303/g.71440 Transcript_62303/m.71440 type:complete len:127 (-) Transcript_62303:164-544(-)